MRRMQSAAVPLVLVISLLGGCGGPATVPVTGKVTFDGAPMPVGGVVFWPDAAKNNTATAEAVGPIENGSYKLNTRGLAGGVLPGWYKVTVSGDAPPDKDKPSYDVPKKSTFPKKYKDASTTPLSVEVVANAAPGAYDLKLTK